MDTVRISGWATAIPATASVTTFFGSLMSFFMIFPSDWRQCGQEWND